MFEKWYNIVEDKLVRWILFIVRMLPNFLLAMLVMALFIILARFVKMLALRLSLRISKSESISGLTSAIMYTLIMVVGIMVSLNILKLDKAVTSLLAGVGRWHACLLFTDRRSEDQNVYIRVDHLH